MISLSPEKFKKILLNENVVDEPTFETIKEEADRRQQNILDLVVSKGFASEDYIYDILSKSLGVERVNFNNINIDEQAINSIPEDIARKKRSIVFNRNEDSSYDVAMEDPTDLETINFLSLKLGSQIRPYLATDRDLNRGYALYGKKITQDFKKIIEDSVKESLRSKAKGVEEAAEDVPIVDIIDNLLAYAISSRASDIHFEILEDAILVRFRIDGVLQEIIRMPKDIHSAIVARIKILSRLRIDEHSKPQDGRFRYKVGDKNIDVRTSVIPTFYGEKAEMRLLDAAQKPLSLEELGMLPDTVDLFKKGISDSYGMILVTGPTGSGKSTTLYSLMNMLNNPEINIVTVEDPIEYDMRYVNQVQVNHDAGITFASGLRSILRQDPNVIMVGEIRDVETANISVQAALTGHMVLSSLHTNDAPTAIPRLMDMGVKQFLASAVLNVVSAQRLVRKVHLACIESYTPDESVYDAVNEQLKNLDIDPSTIKLPSTFYKGKGCNECNHTGYLGRSGIFEVIVITDKIRSLITSNDFNLEKLKSLAREEGMVSMFEDGLRKVERGMTTIEEVFRVIRE
ncbi:MAG: GspE/PulE family protein [Candidatus Paceibacterota bacterium]